ncbi:MAG TPA: hypothetical protein VEB22_04305 [Phycisphaerales bacterium]|nr:hypothetical protein [Phycisphaerales bacterium]
MLQSEKANLLHLVGSLLQNNLGNRITVELTNGVCTTLDALVPAVPDQEAVAAPGLQPPAMPGVAP